MLRGKPIGESTDAELWTHLLVCSLITGVFCIAIHSGRIEGSGSVWLVWGGCIFFWLGMLLEICELTMRWWKRRTAKKAMMAPNLEVTIRDLE